MDTLVDDLSARLAQRLRLERDSRGWSLADLAERSGVSKATISKIERAEVSPTAVVLVRLASAFDLTLAGLMLRAEGQGERLSRACRSAGVARSRNRLSAPPGVQPARPSRSRSSRSRCRRSSA
jgi:transcriptional regulator with XRE-family HTH domain